VVEPVHLIVYSDYLCPWCYNAAVRMRRLEEEFGDEVRVEWRSFLLRPEPRGRRDLEAFRAYTQSWLRPGAEEDSGEFCVWRGEAGPPSHSIPPHTVAKAAARLGGHAFRAVHERLLRAYFTESRDITDAATLRTLWREAGLPEREFARSEDPELLRETLRQHAAALRKGVSGVPAVRMAGNDAAIVGAHPLELYRRWVQRTRAQGLAASS
jgi:predicted DsbA family dithiol-disulfide isomerase